MRELETAAVHHASRRRGGGWPLTARAQQSARLPTIGFLGTATPSTWSQWIAAFEQRLRELGWIEGRTIAIEYRWAEGRDERYAEIAAEFVRLKVDVIVTRERAVLATKRATSIIPIVFALAWDPVGIGMVTSLARPGGNVTGLSIQSTDLAGKRLELLREVVPGLRRLAIMANAAIPPPCWKCAKFRQRPAPSARGRHAGNPASGGYRARFRGAQGPRRRTLCRSRSARVHEPDPNQHFRARRAAAVDLLAHGNM